MLSSQETERLLSELHRRSFLQAAAAAGVASQAAEAGDRSRPGTNMTPPVESHPELRRGPYLQCQGSDRIVVRWRTDESARDVRLRFGPACDKLETVVPARPVKNEFRGVRDWAASVDGLEPATTYYYAIESSSAILAGADDAHWFRTAPARGQAAPFRFWVLGDCGTNWVGTGNPGKSISARNGFRRFNEGRGPLDGILLLGDNAYSHGTDAQYQTALFQVYAEEFRHTPLWPCIGNHDMTEDYFGIFSVPENGELGGRPSRSPGYYSFDHANVHFIVLDLWKTEWSAPDAPQRRWLEADLATTSQPWTIVANHFPPYCDGKYESDSNGYLVDVRQKILPVLEAHGVDLLLTGHDHTYQRSYLLDGHHGSRSTFRPEVHLRSKLDGTSEPILKKHGPHSGIITVVTGTAGAPQPADVGNPRATRLAHPAMVKLAKGDQDGRGSRRPGTFLLEVDGLTLTGTQVDDHGEVIDRFTLRKEL